MRGIDEILLNRSCGVVTLLEFQAYERARVTRPWRLAPEFGSRPCYRRDVEKINNNIIIIISLTRPRVVGQHPPRRVGAREHTLGWCVRCLTT